MLKLELELNVGTFELEALMLKLELVINIEIETFWVLCSALCFDINLFDIITQPFSSFQMHFASQQPLLRFHPFFHLQSVSWI